MRAYCEVGVSHDAYKSIVQSVATSGARMLIVLCTRLLLCAAWHFVAKCVFGGFNERFSWFYPFN